MNNAIEQQIGRLQSALTKLEDDVEMALSRIDELTRQMPTQAAARVDARPYESPSEAPAYRFSGPAGPFSGPVRDIKRQIPVSARDMEFVETHKLLVDKRSSVGHRFKVFRDSHTQDLKVVPWVDSARHRDELAWLHGVFEVHWNGNGDVAVLSDPSLEQTSEGYRIRAKGRLRVG